MSKQGLSRQNRMTERPQFVRLFDKPRVYRSQTFQAFWKSNDKSVPRLGITIKGRLSSVWRARLKRAIREWFRVSKDSIGQVDLNIVIRVPEKLDREFLQLLKRQLKLWKS